MELAKYRIWCDTDGKWEEWYLPASSAAPTTCPVDTSHLVNPAKTHTTGASIQSARLAPDGSLVVKQDPGTETTDPHFHAHNYTFNGIGAHELDLDLPNDGTCRMQYLTIQVSGASFGDRIGVVFRADASGQLPYPENTVLASFGEITAPMDKDVNGWSQARREPQDQGSAKLLIPGVKVTIVYTCVDMMQRKLIVDVCSHCEE